MEKKKIVKPVVIAASVAAIVGIGAVSFAAWNGNNKQTANTAESSTGNISTVGFASAPSALTAITGLMPYDQGSGTRVYSVQLPQFTTTANYTITVTVKDGTTTALSLYAKVGAQVTAAPEGLTDWKAVGANCSFDFNVTTVGQLETVSNKYLNIVLDSESEADMNQKFELTVTLSEQA